VKFRVLILASLLLISPAIAQQQLGTKFFRTKQVSVPTTAGGVQVADTAPTRSRVTITTTGTNQVWCGPDNTISAANGTPIPATASSAITFDTTAQIWCIAVSSAQVVSVAETFN
jgi:hypothetical protein